MRVGVALGQRGEQTGEYNQEHESPCDHQAHPPATTIKRLHLRIEGDGALDGRDVDATRRRRWPDGRENRSDGRRGSDHHGRGGRTALQFLHAALELLNDAIAPDQGLLDDRADDGAKVLRSIRR